MSLKTFHIIFVVISSLLMLYISYWSYSYYAYYKDNYYLSYLMLSILGLVVFALYGNKFIKKYKELI